MENLDAHRYLGTFNTEEGKRLTANGLRNKLLEILQGLHAAGLVYGDFRGTNILVREDIESGTIDVKLVVFDWAGVAGEGQYPANVNCVDIRRPTGAFDEGLITPENDMAMLRYLFPST
ncbi:hypothetical protein FRB94_007243 [Tulasnella sp. JGI-2019a]|nr:hypothetical protein FRB93_007052 [Tulasnella sp. JGI-2019a]KAG8998048.1 hypothetical protein FRB94_007243 [Tulasnella sp. JGI-2019a]KAG9026401.1 hypothetical protein FRB95_008888 [Tulasnella sp. JGI-2019a]